MVKCIEEYKINTLPIRNEDSRTGQVKNILFIFIVLLFLTSVDIASFNNEIWLPEIWGAIAFLIFLMFFVSVDTTNVVTGMATWTATIVTSFLAWRCDGLYDTALLSYPCILMFSAALGGRILLTSLFIFMLSVFFFLAYASSTGLVETTTALPEETWTRSRNMSVLLCIYVVGVIRVSSYIKQLINKLYQERDYSAKLQEEADRKTLYDDLTKLPNEGMCKKELKDIIRNNIDEGNIVGFVTIKLNNILWINSSLGNSVGDLALRILAERFQKLADDNIHIYRSSGPDFILIVGARNSEIISDFSHQILRSTFRSIDIKTYDIEISCSLGVAVAPNDGDSFSTLLQKSTTALYRAREEEATSLLFFEDEMELQASKRLTLVYDLKKAIENSEFELYYQPKVDIKENTIVGAEALIRWRKNGEVLVHPNEFISIAEESGLINEIGKFVIESACTECARWHALKLPHLTVAVNLSPIQFKRGNLPNQVFRALKKSELDPNLLELEITESLFIEDEEHVKNQIYAMSAKGVNFAIDDFGTGYSNLNYLAKFNASTLKIDMSFVTGMVDSEQHRHIVNAIVKMSSVMDIENVAEGVEDEESAEILKEFGCTYGQGLFWSKPLLSNEFVEFVKNWPTKDTHRA